MARLAPASDAKVQPSPACLLRHNAKGPLVDVVHNEIRALAGREAVDHKHGGQGDEEVVISAQPRGSAFPSPVGALASRIAICFARVIVNPAHS
jgi:hypothetical protein